ncbi:MAG: transposase [Verrucomicrobia bacterium]|nr:transposase [Verrucomicrobiota bacterium]
MRQRRLKAPPSFLVAHYHCVSRVVNRDFVFGEQEREHFVRLLREYERFCGVRVLTYCVLANHFHLLVEVPARPVQPLTAEEVQARIEILSGSALTPKRFRQRLDAFRGAGDSEGERAFLDRICATMWDISGYLQRLKQRFTQWFNRRKGRRGVLWEARFKSVLVEGAGEPLSTMAAYIDLNPVRAGLVEDPKDYRWCGYGAAAVGDASAREGIATVIAMAQRRPEAAEDPAGAMATYRMWLFGQGEEREGTAPDGGSARRYWWCWRRGGRCRCRSTCNCGYGTLPTGRCWERGRTWRGCSRHCGRGGGQRGPTAPDRCGGWWPTCLCCGICGSRSLDECWSGGPTIACAAEVGGLRQRPDLGVAQAVIRRPGHATSGEGRFQLACHKRDEWRHASTQPWRSELRTPLGSQWLSCPFKGREGDRTSIPRLVRG